MATVLDEPATTKLTADEFAALPSDQTRGCELVDGELREKPVSHGSSRLGVRLASRLLLWADRTGAGDVSGPDELYAIFPDDPNRVRKPDVSFIRAGRLPPNADDLGIIRVVPDFVAEVLSPNDVIDEVDEKLLEYRAAGVPLVWVLHPRMQEVRVYELGRPTRIYGAEDELSGDPILPGFTVRVADLFPPSRAAARPSAAP